MRFPPIGYRVLGAAALFLGVVGLLWGDFATPWQPVPPETPLRAGLAYLLAAGLAAGGAAMQWRPTRRWAALAVSILFALPAIFWVKRVIGYPLIFGTWAGLAEQAAVIAGGVIVFATSGAPRRTSLAEVARYVVGLCCVAFGVVHFQAMKETAAVVPAYLPLGGDAWAMITGVAHVMGGLAILGASALPARIGVWGARLLTAMYAGFGLLVWLPRMFTDPKEHLTWGGNGINLALVGAVWIVADALAERTDRAAVKAAAPV